MRANYVVLSMAAILTLAPAPTSAQTTGTDTITAFVQTVRNAAAKYRDRADAVRAGYRRIGPDFPGMGEHWIQPARLVSGRFRADSPPILTYVTIAGQVVLAGAAFALPLAAGETPPDFPSTAHWHDHSASVDEESLLIAPAARHWHDTAATGTKPHIAMLHVWFGLANPDGVFAQDNWALPFARLGVAPPSQSNPSAARALSLLSGGATYYRDLFGAAAPLGADEAAFLDRLLASGRTELEQWVALQSPGWNVEPSSISALANRWNELWRRIQQNVSPATWQRLAPFAPAHH